MKILANILALFGFTGKSLDKAISQMTKLDKYLEEVEALENAKVTAANAAAEKAKAEAEAATANAEKAKRIRGRAQEFVA